MALDLFTHDTNKFTNNPESNSKSNNLHNNDSKSSKFVDSAAFDADSPASLRKHQKALNVQRIRSGNKA